MNAEVAKAVLSGAYERRRGYLTNLLTAWNQLAVTGTLAIWAFLVRWDTLLGSHPDKALFATQVAWAGALSSILVGLWRYWARVVDNDIVRLYPVIYLAERFLLPAEVCTIRHPKGTAPLSPATITAGIEYRQVPNSDFGSRGHAAFDWVGACMITLFAVISVLVAASYGVITFSCVNLRDPVVVLLVANMIGLALIGGGHLWWKRKKHDWPVPKAIHNAGGDSV